MNILLFSKRQLSLLFGPLCFTVSGTIVIDLLMFVFISIEISQNEFCNRMLNTVYHIVTRIYELITIIVIMQITRELTL